MSRKIIHIDADCFYAAIEMRDNPSFIGRPLAVGGSAERRGVISTCNYEARAWGVHSAMATARALKLCPELNVVKPRMEVYREVSKAMHRVFQCYTDIIEPLSLDEAFLDVTEVEHLSGSATWIAKEIQQRIWRELNITISAGVAPNKFLAKIASDWRKPNGLYVIPPQAVDEFVLELPVAKLHGVGKVTLAKLQRMGVNDCKTLRSVDRLILNQQFGSFGDRLWQLAHGVDERAVESNIRRQTVSVEQTYAEDLPNLKACEHALPELLAELMSRYARLDSTYRAEKPLIKLKFNDFTQTTLEQAGLPLTLATYLQLLHKAYQRGNKPVRLIGVGLRLQDLTLMRQLELFEEK